MDTKGISMQRLIDEIAERNYAVPALPDLKENLKNLEPQLRLILDERFDARGKVLWTYEVISEKEGISLDQVGQLIENIFWILAGKPENIPAHESVSKTDIGANRHYSHNN